MARYKYPIIITFYILLIGLAGADFHANDSKKINHNNFKEALLGKVKELKESHIYLSHKSGAECIIVEDDGGYHISIKYLVSLARLELDEYIDIPVMNAMPYTKNIPFWKLDLEAEKKLDFFLFEKGLTISSKDSAKYAKKSYELLFFEKVIEIDAITDYEDAYTIAEIYFSKIDTDKEEIETNIH